jgi:hypothetical protein
VTHTTLLASGDEYCRCGFTANDSRYGYIYFYEHANGMYWNYLTEYAYYDTFPMSDGDYNQCASLCSLDATNIARSLCSYYGNPNYHVQIQFWFTFEDPDGSNGGTVEDFLDTGASILMCGSF